MIRQTKTSAEAASPGPLQKETQWKHWEEKFTNYAKAHIGASGVPLSFERMIRHVHPSATQTSSRRRSHAHPYQESFMMLTRRRCST